MTSLSIYSLHPASSRHCCHLIVVVDASSSSVKMTPGGAQLLLPLFLVVVPLGVKTEEVHENVAASVGNSFSVYDYSVVFVTVFLFITSNHI